VKPSWFGESIGHYESGNTLVVDTIGLSTHNSYIDNFRTPHTEKLHVVERFTVEPDGKYLSAVATVDDPDTFNAPLSMKQRWFKVNNPMSETVCAENNEDFFHQNLFPMPEAKSADF
jgi:Tol biopolymer transport system component